MFEQSHANISRNLTKDNLMRLGATASAAVSFGLVTTEARAVDRPEAVLSAAPAKIETDPKPQMVPKGVRSIVSETAIQQESGRALQKLNKKWNGVLVLHAPKKNVWVGFSKSPSAYTTFDEHLTITGPHSLESVTVVRPGIERFRVGTKTGHEYRDYAVVYDQDRSTWGFLDIKFAEESGALSAYAFKGITPKAVPYGDKDTAEMPVIYEYTESPRSKYEMQSIYLPNNLDSNRKKQILVPSPIVPHP